MLTTIDRSIKYICLMPLDDRTSEEIYRGLEIFQSHYNRAGFLMKLMHRGGVFKSIMDEVEDNLGISVNYSNPDYHVP